jgi:carboxylesterase
MSELEGCEPMSAAGSGDRATTGVLVLHGFTGCPQSMRPLALELQGAGYTVELPLLPGHGTTVDDMITTGWGDWTAAAEAAYTELAGRCDRVVVAGLSMGGALTAWLGSEHQEIAGLVCINPILDVGQDLVDLATQMLEAGTDRIDAVGGDIADPESEEAAYTATPLGPLLSLAEGTSALRENLANVTSPLLLLNSPQDHLVPPANSDLLAGAVSGPVERVSLERSYHVATIDYDAPLIAGRTLAFVQQVTAS